MQLVLQRTAHSQDGVCGTLYLTPDGVSDRESVCVSACPALRIVENAAYMIPAGSYPVQVTYSPRFKRRLPLVMGVAGRSGIRMHAGSRPDQSRGCLLVGSRAQEEWLSDQLAEGTHRLRIENAY